MNLENITSFKDDEILTFYSLVYYVENEIRKKNSKGFNVLNTEFKQFCTRHNLIITATNSEDIRIKKQSAVKNSIYFTDTKNSYIASILTHFRNAICHAQIKEYNNSLIFEDKHNENITMFALLERELLAEFINAMKATRK